MKSQDAAIAVRGKLARKRGEAKASWKKLEQAKDKAIAAGPKALSPTAPEYLALKAAGAEYDRVCDELDVISQLAKAHDRGPAMTAGDHIRAATGMDPEAIMTHVRAWRAGQGWALSGPGSLANLAAPVQPSDWITLCRRDDFRNAVTALTTSPISPSTRLPGVETVSDSTLEFLRRIPVVPSESSVATWMLESVATLPAAETAEGVDVSLASEATLTYSEEDAPCVDVDVTLPIALQVLNDDPQAQAFFTGRLMKSVLHRVQSQAISGAGGGDLLGLPNAGIGVQDVLGGYTIPDLVAKAATRIRKATLSQYEPDVVLLSPDDYDKLILAKSTLSGDNYFPLNAGRLWSGLTPLPHVAVPDGAPLVGATAATQLVVHEDVQAYISKSHATHFVSGVADVLARINCYFVVKCPAAWVQITAFAS